MGMNITDDLAETCARAIEATMFADHELPITGELHQRYLETAHHALAAVYPAIAAAEREECAQTVEFKAASHAPYQRSQISAGDYAAAIRARKTEG